MGIHGLCFIHSLYKLRGSVTCPEIPEKAEKEKVMSRVSFSSTRMVTSVQVMMHSWGKYSFPLPQLFA